MSEELQQIPAEVLPEANSGDTGCGQPATGTRARASNPQPPTQPQAAREPDGEEMKALAKAFAVNLAWTIAGLFDKK